MNEESKNDDNIFYIGESYYDEIDQQLFKFNITFV